MLLGIRVLDVMCKILFLFFWNEYSNVILAIFTALVVTEVLTLFLVFTGIVYKPPEYQEHVFTEAPKFTTPLADHAATVGYTTKLLCSVRGSPKVRHTHFPFVHTLQFA